MIRFLLSALILLASAACLYAAPLPDTHAGDVHGVIYSGARIVDLPQDQGKLYVAVMGHANDPRFQNSVRWFDTVPALRDVKAQTHFQVHTSNSAMYRSRYAQSVPALPCIRVIDAQGNVYYQASGDNLPTSGEAIANIFVTECFRRWCRPAPQPQPQPAPEPDFEPYEPQPDVQPHPDVRPQPVPASNAIDWVAIVASVALGLGGGGVAGLVRAYKDQHYPQDK